MKISILKKNKEGIARICNRGGFALLFSVLISSLLLTIGLSIFSITLKEMALSTASRQSIHAFFAADSGRECALYWDTKRGEIPNLFGSELMPITGTITCGNQIITAISDYHGATKPDDADEVDIEIGTPPGSVFVAGGGDGPNYYVKIHREIDRVASILTTSITATGHDSSSGNRVEREIREDF